MWLEPNEFDYEDEGWHLDPFDDKSWVRSAILIGAVLLVAFMCGLLKPRPQTYPVQGQPCVASRTPSFVLDRDGVAYACMSNEWFPVQSR